MIVARFYVAEVKKFAYNPQNLGVVLQAVSRGPENKEWAAATPTGKIEMSIGNEAAAAWFESMLGHDVAVTFEARPISCVHCKKETGVVSQYGSGADSFVLGGPMFGYAQGDTLHSACYEELSNVEES